MAISRWLGGTRLTRLPSIRMSPEVASSRPAMIRRSVDFPQPEGPTKTQNSPSATSRSTPLITSVVPKDLVTAVRVRAPMRSSELDRLAGADALVGGEADAERGDGVGEVAGQVDVLGDGAGDEGGLAVAEVLVARARRPC